MKSLDCFLNPGGEGSTFVVVSPRFKDDNGPVEWELRPLTTKEIQVIGKRFVKDGVVDQQEFTNAILCQSVVYPDLNNADLQKSYKVVGASDLLTTMLKPGEYSLLKEKVLTICGIDSDINSQVEEAKN